MNQVTNEATRRATRRAMSQTMRRAVTRLLVMGVGALALAACLAAPAAAFTDVTADHDYAAAIADLSARGVINGYLDDTFRPESPVWRQHFAKMIVLALGLPYADVTTCPFADVPKTYPYPAGFVSVAFTNGITIGKTSTTFGPTDEISRAQVITMVVRAAQTVLPPGTLATPPAGYGGTWGRTFDSTHGPNAATAEYNGLLAGIPLGEGGPWVTMPRGEVAQVLHNLLVRMAAVPPSPDVPLQPGDPFYPPDLPPSDVPLQPGDPLYPPDIPWPPDVPLPPDSPLYPPELLPPPFVAAGAVLR